MAHACFVEINSTHFCFADLRWSGEPFQRFIADKHWSMQDHEPLILNWFRVKGEISSGAVESLNNQIRVATGRSYGFITFEAMEIALYHNLGRFPEPESAPQVLLGSQKG